MCDQINESFAVCDEFEIEKNSCILSQIFV